uniref:Fork-head domain-containing protein n=1 Tax=Caenorhabditis tropicalis TaxID=1561998 RepID=A0A1I7UAA1_9PELO
MSELNSSLCQLNWLIAKGGIGNVQEPDITIIPEKTSPVHTNSLSQNSIRHNLSLNKQFSRIEKQDGDRRGWWICVDPPAKKPRILKGSPVRVNPIYEQLYQNKLQDNSSNTFGKEDHFLSEINGDGSELTDQEIRDLNLFESYDLNSSFRDVYNQIFEKPSTPNQNQHTPVYPFSIPSKYIQAARIDWLKISLEAAGIDCNSEQDLREVDTDKLKDYAYNRFTGDYDSNTSTPRTDSSRHSSSDSNLSNTLQPIPNHDSDEEYDWDRLL